MRFFLITFLVLFQAIYSNAVQTRAGANAEAKSFYSLDVFDQEIRGNAKKLLTAAEPLTKGAGPYIDMLADIIFDRSVTSKTKFEEIHTTPDARFDKKTSEKTNAALLKVEKVIAYYQKEVLNKSSPKVKTFYGKVEKALLKPSPYLKMSEDQIVDNIKSTVEGMSEKETQDAKEGIKKVMDQVKKEKILEDLTELAGLLNKAFP
ncbi:hypothetical protein WR25_24262 [Diploscapter pachys]|uniref:SXP/RAL-2 family protein Ani s 5-like cation-binding domain-containing protein n=1 Tax=Diploscapter pachys TaxID=2018661 RepID=A0A2A2LK66_9BILA|nr:hypothetical protein WR25_24262 [Diploscapter pachys]